MMLTSSPVIFPERYMRTPLIRSASREHRFHRPGPASNGSSRCSEHSALTIRQRSSSMTRPSVSGQHECGGFCVQPDSTGWPCSTAGSPGGGRGGRPEGAPEERGATEPRLAGELTLRERDGWWATTADVRRILDGAAGVSVEVAVNNDSEATLVCGLTASDPGGAQPHHETTLVCGLSGQAFAGNPGDP